MPAAYGKPIEVKRVKMKVPEKSSYMEFVSAHKFKNAEGETIFVEEHWRSYSNIHGMLVQRNFFGITREQLGKNVVGDIKIRQKKTSKSKKMVSLIDVWVNAEKAAQYRLAFEKDEAGRLWFPLYEIRQPQKTVA